MCPEKERYSRLMQGTESFYECDGGEFNPDKAVKEYSRSAADQVNKSLSIVFIYMFPFKSFYRNYHYHMKCDQ